MAVIVCIMVDFKKSLLTLFRLSTSSDVEIKYTYSMVSSAIWKKHARVSFSIARVRIEVFEKLTSVCFIKLHEKPYYYLLIICMKKFRVNYIFICSQ